MENELFLITYKDTSLDVERLDISGQTFFRISFPDKVPPLTILRAVNFEGAKFWTSMPEVRQQLAEEIGTLVEQYYRSIK